MTDNDSRDGKTPATTRRRFLGAAAAAAGLAGFTGTSTATSNQPDIDIERGDYGTVRGTLPKRSSNGGFLELYNPHDRDATVRAKAWHISDDEEESHVALSVAMDACNFSVNVTPEEARTIAQDLEAAADVAEGKHGN